MRCACHPSNSCRWQSAATTTTIAGVASAPAEAASIITDAATALSASTANRSSNQHPAANSHQQQLAPTSSQQQPKGQRQQSASSDQQQPAAANNSHLTRVIVLRAILKFCKICNICRLIHDSRGSQARDQCTCIIIQGLAIRTNAMRQPPVIRPVVSHPGWLHQKPSGDQQSTLDVLHVPTSAHSVTSCY